MNPEKEARAITLKDGKIAIMIYQKWWESVIADTFTLMIFAAMVGLGIFMNSPAMQWIAGIAFLTSMVAKATNISIKKVDSEAAIAWIRERAAE